MNLATLAILCCFLCHMGIATAAQPNLMLIFPDQLRYDWIGTTYHSYGVPLHTPHINDLAENGTRFTRAIVAAPVCAPSRACLASGKEYDEAGVPSNFKNDYPVNETTFYTLLERAGYHVMVSGKDDLTKASGGPGPNGWKHGKALGFSDQERCCGKEDVVHHCCAKQQKKTEAEIQEEARLQELRRRHHRLPGDPFGLFLNNHSANHTSLWQLHIDDFVHHEFSYNPLPDYAYQDNYICRVTLEMLKRKPANKPWFTQINIAGPHPPFDITKDMQSTVIGRKFPGPHGYNDTKKVIMNRKWYAGEIERIDYWVGQFMDFLRTTKETMNTVVCFASDHGEMLGDYGLWGKSKPWQGSISVPLICRGPGILKNKTITAPTSTMDLAGTFLDYAGANKAPGMTTQSLRDVLEGKSTQPSRTNVLSGLNNFRTVTHQYSEDQIFKYVCCLGRCPGSWFNGRKNYVSDADEIATEDELVALSDYDAEEDLTDSNNESHLFNIAVDRFDQHDVKHMHPEKVQHLATLLPPPYNKACA